MKSTNTHRRFLVVVLEGLLLLHELVLVGLGLGVSLLLAAGHLIRSGLVPFVCILTILRKILLQKLDRVWRTTDTFLSGAFSDLPIPIRHIFSFQHDHLFVSFSFF